MVDVGIDAINFHTSNYYLDLAELAYARECDVAKFYDGLGQRMMGLVPPDEDIVTMGAAAALRILQYADLDTIDTLLFATESGIDFSKSAGIYVHELLNLPKRCRVVELKQACYSGTAGLQLASALAARDPDKKVLLIASDVARYGLNTSGESSQGCGAVAMLISANPRVLIIEPEYGVHTSDVMDFWRPNYCDVPIVKGKYSSMIYLRVLEQAWQHYNEKSGRGFKDHDFYCYHASVPRLVEKAHKFLAKINGVDDLSEEQIVQQLDEALKYPRIIGNSYSAALYISLVSLLDNHEKSLSGSRIGFYSYGSGCVAEYFSGIVQDDYQSVLNMTFHREMLESRKALSFDLYEKFHAFSLPEDGSDYRTESYQMSPFRLVGIKSHQRIYEKTE